MISIQKDVSLKNLSSYKIGGPAKYFLKISNIDELIKGLEEWEKIQQKDSPSKPTLPGQGGVFVLGGGTNILIDDRGFSGLVIHPNIKFIKKTPSTASASSLQASSGQDPSVNSGQVIFAGAGILIEDLLAFCIKNSLSGFEWAGGLPGTLGGAIRGNAGAFRGEIKDSVLEVTSLDIKTLKIKKRGLRDCRFDYRSSVFKSQREKESGRERVRGKKSQRVRETEGQEIILEAVLSLKKGNKDKIEKGINEKIEYRKNRHPLEYPNIGSIFKNISLEKVPQKLLKQLKNSIKDDPFPILPTAKLLALAGLKGKRVGGAMVSQKHPNFIVNFDNASSADVKTLIYKIKKIIKDKYGIELEEEITII